jgi:5-aminolevulinate synthase
LIQVNSTRNIAGTTHGHVLLERELAAWHGKDAALLFTSGFVSNEATLGVLARHLPNAVVYSDAQNHASMIAGIRNSRAEYHIFRHNDARHLRALMAATDRNRPKIVAFESIYSMDGDMADLPALLEVAEHHDVGVLIDEAHSILTCGEKGRGVIEYYDADHRIGLLYGTFTKALAGLGGFVSGEANLMQYLRYYADPYQFSCALTP